MELPSEGALNAALSRAGYGHNRKQCVLTDTPECGVCFLYVNRPVRTRMPGGVGRAVAAGPYAMGVMSPSDVRA
jgi:hypothetical protein